MGRPRSFDHDAARARVLSGEPIADVARDFGVTPSAIRWNCRQDPGLRPGSGHANPRILAALGLNEADPVRAAQEAALSARVRALRSCVRAVGPICVDSPTVAAAHAAGLTLDDIEEVFAVPPAEAVRAIAAHAGR
ncbi:hypothetical protein [Methylobacterium tarhaniae]|uniref:hypothetical protein n=1 Tax=Methylobacterium tarhaniae TaxID=1187852 RepID=UPI003D06F9F2